MANVYTTLKGKTSGDDIYPNIDPQNIPNGAVSTSKIDDGAVTTAKIANNSITTGKIADRAIDHNKIAMYGIYAENLEEGCVTHYALGEYIIENVNLADECVDDRAILAESITEDCLADGCITTGKLDNGSVTNSKIANDTIQDGKIKHGHFSLSQYSATYNGFVSALYQYCYDKGHDIRFKIDAGGGTYLYVYGLCFLDVSGGFYLGTGGIGDQIEAHYIQSSLWDPGKNRTIRIDSLNWSTFVNDFIPHIEVYY